MRFAVEVCGNEWPSADTVIDSFDD